MSLSHIFGTLRFSPSGTSSKTKLFIKKQRKKIKPTADKETVQLCIHFIFNQVFESAKHQLILLLMHI